ncbi:hypothetical protein [Gaetbulibacter jejuensis]|uniref:hypothetical protein n=1 Tax=Gaetbulibacter jejuensis TaxID=584607 RepID=UPI00300BA449
MKQQLLFITLLLFTVNLSAQDAFLSMGRNFTTYDFENSEGLSNDKIEGGSGAFYEAGVAFDLDNWIKGLSYAPSITLNQYNASGGDLASAYRWETNYLGLNNTLKLNVLNNSDYIDLSIKMGIGLATIINGQQSINGLTYDLTENDEFKGLWIQPHGGFDIIYFAASDIGIGAGYTFTKAFGGKDDGQSLSFNNSQLQFLIKINLN